MTGTEQTRLQYLNKSGTMYTPPAEGFDAVVGLVSSILSMPIALICLLDAEQVWFKAKHGLDFDRAARKHSFCDYVVTYQEPLILSDTLQDRRFRNNAIMKGALGIRFYAGVPLIENGICLGSLCVMDREVRGFEDEDLRRLEGFATIVLGLLREPRQASILREQQRELRIRQARFEQTERSAKVGGFEMDLLTGKFIWSDQIYRTVGLPIGMPLTRKKVLGCYAPEEREHVERRIKAAMDGNGDGTDRDYRILTPEGEERWVHIVSDVEMIDGAPRRLFGILQDVTERYRQERGLVQAANSDALTGLANRACFKAAIDRQISQDRAEFGLLLIDVDHLKVTNDTLGHGAGDVLLKEIANRLVSQMGKKGTVFRVGGDEFAAVIEKPVSNRGMTMIARGLIRAVSEPMTFNGVTINPKITLGGAICDGCTDAEVLCQNADFALYHAKQTAKGTYVHFELGLRTKISRRLAVTNEVEEALAENRLFPYYQPIVRIQTGEIVGVEALVRMRLADGSVRAAGDFHEALKDASISHRVTSLMLEKVANDLRNWYDSGLKPLRVGINISSSDFSRGDLESRIASAFARYALSLDSLRLEVTESVFMEGTEEAVAATLQRLRKKGASVALDDFGTGYASLTHLQRLPVDVIKIDKSFIDTMLTDASSDAIVELMLELSRKMDLRVTAEGVETIEQAIRLDELGCASGQGYLYARPMDASAIYTLVATTAGKEHQERPALQKVRCSVF
ncbi:EAL domain-containing protein [Agrobacterium vitis]|nr:EAL domain-containing protein [Agrobacterium vitis]MUO95771.1 EAL domain-containing protein [Agrobacterium vitis]MVA93850.1 EAL domain-containing protein [Agrobacterium vitis]MVB03643.1 EAL domain-containing protein [Agrobacterium vitis]